jgi:hypothetical protein
MMKQEFTQGDKKMRNKVIGKFLGLALLAVALTILGTSSAMAVVATGTTTINANIPTAASITVVSSVTLSQGGGDTFTTDWTGTDTVTLSYRATKSTGSATLEVSAAAVAPPGGPALSNFFLTTTGWTGATGSLNSTSAQAFPSSNTTIFTDAAGNHASSKSFNAAYSLVSGDYAADTYSVLLTYTFTVL